MSHNILSYQIANSQSRILAPFSQFRLCVFLKKHPPIPFPLFLLCGPNILLLHESFLLFYHICFSSPLQQQTKYFLSPYYFFLFLPCFSSPPKNFSKYFLPLPSMFNSSSTFYVAKIVERSSRIRRVYLG